MTVTTIGYNLANTRPTVQNTPSPSADPAQARPAAENKASADVNGATKKVSEAEKQPSSKELNEALKDMNDFVGSLNNSLRFTVDDETGKTIVKVLDTQTNEVIKQIPSEEMVAIAKALDKLKGLLVQQKA